VAGKRQPIALVQAKGRKHLTQAEIAARETGEVTVTAPKTGDGSKIRAPVWLPAALREDFNDLRAQLVEAGIFARMDRDTLGRYLVSSQQWTAATGHVQAALDAEDAEEAAAWASLQEKFFKAARACAADLGLTITSRCRLVVPKAPEPEEDEFTAFLRRRQAAGD